MLLLRVIKVGERKVLVSLLPRRSWSEIPRSTPSTGTAGPVRTLKGTLWRYIRKVHWTRNTTLEAVCTRLLKTSICATPHKSKIRTRVVPAKETNQTAGYQILKRRVLNVVAPSSNPEPTSNASSPSLNPGHVPTYPHLLEARQNPRSIHNPPALRGTRVPQRDIFNRR